MGQDRFGSKTLLRAWPVHRFLHWTHSDNLPCHWLKGTIGSNQKGWPDADSVSPTYKGVMRRVLIAFPKAGLHLYSQILNIGLGNHIGLVRSPTDKSLMTVGETITHIRATEGDLSGHFPYSAELAEELESNFDYLILISRDLRDVVCSLVDHVARSSTTGFNINNSISNARDKISCTIPMVATWAKMFLGWAGINLFHLTYGEFILDRKGTLERIHENIPGCGTIDEMMERSNHKTDFFNVGTIDRWTQYFTDEHIRLAEMYFEPLMEADIVSS